MFASESGVRRRQCSLDKYFTQKECVKKRRTEDAEGVQTSDMFEDAAKTPDWLIINQNNLNIYSLLYLVLCHSMLESLVEFLKGIYLLPLLCKTLLTRLSFCFVCLNFKLSSLIVTILLCTYVIMDLNENLGFDPSSNIVTF